MKNAYMPKSKNQEHLTPDRVYDLIEEHWGIEKELLFDPVPPATPFRSPCFFNALYQTWHKVNYVNPPFAKEILEKFVEKAIFEACLNNSKTIMLLPSKTDQDWFHEMILDNDFEILWIRKRLKFKNNKNHATDTHFLVMIK